MKISTRFILSISVMFLGYLITLIVSYTLGNRTSRQLDYAARGLFPAVVESRRALTASRMQAKAYEDAVVLGESLFLEKAQTSGKEVQEALKNILKSKRLSKGMGTNIKVLLNELSLWSISADEVYSNLTEMDLEASQAVIEKSRDLTVKQKSLQSRLTKLVTTLTDSLTSEHDAVVKLTRIQGLSNIILFCIVIVVSLVAVSIMLKRMVGPIQSLAETARLIQDGDLDRRAEVNSKDEIGELGNAFNSMTDKISRAVSKLEAEVTERKRAQEEVARHRDNLEELVNERTAELTKTNANLEESEKQNRALIDTASQAGIGIVVILDEGNEKGYIRYANKMISNMSGYDEEELMEKHMLDLLNPDDHEKAKTMYLHRSPGQEIPQMVEYIGLSKENEIIPLEISSGETEYSGKKAMVSYISDISKRKEAEAELVAAQQELVEKAHQAGMADIATGTLHNVGNILNSVKTSAQMLCDVTERSQLEGLKKANNLLRENMNTMDEFILENPKGMKLMQYYLVLEDGFDKEKEIVQQHLKRLTDKVNAIVEVILAQQSYAGASALTEDYSLHEIINDALTMQSGTTERYNITVIKDFKDVPKVSVQKTKLVHILINLIRNAKDAMLEITAEKRILKLSVYSDDDAAYIKVTDSGQGIFNKDLKGIFVHGFTTKKEGHGFGLHSSANYMTEMHGQMWAESEGEGMGATFVLKFPFMA